MLQQQLSKISVPQQTLISSPQSQNSLQALTFCNQNCNNEQLMLEDLRPFNKLQRRTNQLETPFKIRMHLDMFQNQTITPLYKPSIENDEVPDIDQLSADAQSKAANNHIIIGGRETELQNKSLQSQLRSHAKIPLSCNIQKEMRYPKIRRFRIAIQVTRFAVIAKRMLIASRRIEMQQYVPAINKKQYNLINDQAAQANYFNSETFNSQIQLFSGSQQALSSNNLIVATIKKYKKNDSIVDQKRKKKTQMNIGLLIKRGIHYFKKLVSYLDSTVPIIDQQSTFLMYWQGLIALLTTIGIVYDPFRFSFNEKTNIDYSYLKFIFFAFFLIDILLQANSSYFDKGNPVIKRASIIRQYVKTKLVFDIITIILPIICIFYEIYFNQWNQSAFGILKLLFIARIVNLSNYLTEKRKSLVFAHFTNILISVFFQAIIVLYIIHFLSCALFFISMEEFKESGKGWIKKNDLQDEPNTIQYLYSLQELVNLLFHSNSSFKVNSLYPSDDDNNEETITWKIFTIFIKINSLGLTAYFINSLHYIFKKYYKTENQHNQQLNKLSMYLNKHDVKSYLRKRALKYLEYQYELNELVSTGGSFCIKHSQSIDCIGGISGTGHCGQKAHSLMQSTTQFQSFEQNLNCLPSYIKDQIVQDANIKVLQKVEFLNNNFSEGFLQALALVMHESIYNQGEVIQLQNTLEEPNLSFVAEGEVELYIEIGSKINERAQIKQLELIQAPGGSFGQLEFFTQNYEVKYSVQATCFSRVLKVSLTDFINVIKKFPSDREQFCYLKDQVVLYRNMKKISVSCVSCFNAADHSTLECPYLFYGRIMKSIVEKGIQQINLQIKLFKRSKIRRKFKTLSMIQCIQDKALVFLQQMRQENIDSDSSNDDNDVFNYCGQSQVDQDDLLFEQQQEEEKDLMNSNIINKGRKIFERVDNNPSSEVLAIESSEKAVKEDQSKKQIDDLQERIDKSMKNNLNLINPFSSWVSINEALSDPNLDHSTSSQKNKSSPTKRRKSSLLESNKEEKKQDKQSHMMTKSLELKREFPKNQISDQFIFVNEENSKNTVKSERQIKEHEQIQSKSPYNKSKKSQYCAQHIEPLNLDAAVANHPPQSEVLHEDHLQPLITSLVQQQQKFLQQLEQKFFQQSNVCLHLQPVGTDKDLDNKKRTLTNLQTGVTIETQDAFKVLQSGSSQFFEQEPHCNCKRPFMFDLDFVDESNNAQLNMLVAFTKYYPNNNYQNVIEQFNNSYFNKKAIDIIQRRKNTKSIKKQSRMHHFLSQSPNNQKSPHKIIPHSDSNQSKDFISLRQVSGNL